MRGQAMQQPAERSKVVVRIWHLPNKANFVLVFPDVGSPYTDKASTRIVRKLLYTQY